MPDTAADEKPRRRFRFSLLALLLFVTAACVALAWFVQPKRCRAVALFRVDSSPKSLLDNDMRASDPRQFSAFQQTQLEFLKSHFVLQSAVRDPAIASLAILSAQAEPVDWLAENIEAEFPAQSEILAISLAGPASQANDLRLLVDAVVQAYEEQVLYVGRQEQLLGRDAKERVVADLRKEIDEKSSSLKEIVAKGNNDTSDIKLREMELDVLTNLWKQLLLAVEVDDVEANAPDRIHRIQNAVIQLE